MNITEFDELIKNLKNSPNLNLTEKEFTVLQIETLAGLIENIKEIHTINLASNKLEDEGLEKIISALIKKNMPTAVSFYNNDLSAQALGYIAKGLKKGIFIDLNLGANIISKENLEEFISALSINNNLKSLDIGINMLRAIHLKPLLQALKTHPTLSAIYLGHNQINDEVCVNITDILKSSKIIKIDLKSNYITASGATIIAQSLKNNYLLQELDLRQNKIGVEGKVALIKSMKMNFVLTNLQFDEDNIIAPYITRNKLLVQNSFDQAIKYYFSVLKDYLINPITAKDLFILKTHENFVIQALNEQSISFENFQVAIYRGYVLLNLPKIKGWCKNIKNLGNFNDLLPEIKEHIFSFLDDEYLYPTCAESAIIDMSNLSHTNFSNLVGIYD